jgi:RNA-directed DNA polymerase
VSSPVLANLFMHWAFDAWLAREFPACPFERYADDAIIHCTTERRARQVLAALERRMADVGLELHPGKTRIVYCKDGQRTSPWEGPVSFDFLGFTFRARPMAGKHGLFTGYGPAVSGKALARMGETVRSWRLRHHADLTWQELAKWIGPVIQGWISYYGTFYKSELYPLLARINYHVQKWARAKYRRLRPAKAMLRAWERVTTQYPRSLPHWKWNTNAWR